MKRSIMIWSSCIAVLIVFSCYIIPFGSFRYANRWKYTVENFDEYKADFEITANFCRDYFENKRPDQQYPNDWIYYGSYNREKFLSYNGTRLDISSDLQDAINRIDQAFADKDSNLAVIRYDTEGVAFEIENGRYSLVYSFYDKKPVFIKSADGNYDILIRKIENHWYHTVIEPN